VKPILAFLRLPARGVIERLVFFAPHEVAVIYMKIAIFSGLVMSLPLILYQVWKFISPAIEEEHRSHVFGFVFFTFTTFLIGAGFAYFYLVPLSLKFLMKLGGNELTPFISLSRYLSFVLALVFGCGLVFEMPVFIWILTKLKIVNAEFLRRKRKYALALIFIAAAVITPTIDPFNMFFLALPMLLLYEISIWISRWQKQKDFELKYKENE
jgi:sec-independent protein translocase protein TatC